MRFVRECREWEAVCRKKDAGGTPALPGGCPSGGVDHSGVKKISTKLHEGRRRATKALEETREGCAKGREGGRSKDHPGARASRPHKAWHSLGHLFYLNRLGTAPWLYFGLPDAVPTDRVAGCRIARKLSGNQGDSMRAGRPRSQVMPSRRCGSFRGKKDIHQGARRTTKGHEEGHAGLWLPVPILGGRARRVSSVGIDIEGRSVCRYRSCN